ncbi:MAG TPA: glutathione S-transferase family protein [Ramlibacter sp.]|jgi:glutathione S-transferase
MLTIHHLGKSQSERIVWMCEELQLPYALQRYERDAVTMLAPPELRLVHPMGAAPVITDGDLVLAESGAIVQYLLATHGGGRLAPDAAHPDFAQYLYWFHFANGNLQPHMGRLMILGRLQLPPDHPVLVAAKGRIERVLRQLDARLATATWLAGEAFTAADIMMVFSLSTMRYFAPLDLAPYPSVQAYLKRVGERPAYRRAMDRGDPGMPLLLA